MYNSKYIVYMNLETRIIIDFRTSYCVSNSKGKFYNSFYLTTYIRGKGKLKDSIQYLMKIKYHNDKIYLHNFYRIHAVFLIRLFIDLSDKVKPIIRASNFLS
uniref:hypothetical protein n=1 Tax=Squamanita imbachii TaxID=2976389 RepID=UPI0030DFBB17